MAFCIIDQEQMNRRQFLVSASGSLLLSGCLGGGSDEQVEPSFTIDADPVPIGFNAVFNVSVASDGTEDQPPTISFSLENSTNAERSYGVLDSTIGLPFDGTVGEGPDGATLGLTDDADSLNFDRCWKGSLLDGGGSGPDSTTLASGEEIAADLYLYNDEESDTCWQEGDYRFDQEYRMGSSDTDVEDWPSYDWGFTVTVETE